MTKINPEKPVPAPEDVSKELRSLYERQIKLSAELDAVNAEQRALMLDDAASRHEADRRHQVDALIRGSAYEPPAATRVRMAELAKRRDLVTEAIREIANLIREERMRASRLVVDEFRAEQAALAAEFFQNLAKTIAVHSRFGEMKRRLERAGVDTSSLADFGRDLFGSPNVRSDHAAYALRYGVRFGHIKAEDCPAGYL